MRKATIVGATATVWAAKQAFPLAAMTPVHVNVAEVHHFFTGVDSISYEDLGFAERFGASKLLEAEEMTIGGGLAVNTSGGLTAEGRHQGRPPMLSAALARYPQSPLWEGPVVHG